MLGEPVADIAEPIDMARQIDAVAQGGCGFGASGDDGEVEDGKRDHGDKLVRRPRATKALTAQIRGAPGRTWQAPADELVGRLMTHSLFLRSAHSQLKRFLKGRTLINILYNNILPNIPI